MKALPVNTILCGDCLEVMRDWPDGCVDLVLTDPPYGQTSLTWDVPVRAWTELLPLGPTGSLWVFGNLRFFMVNALEFAQWKIAQDVVWEKHNGSIFHADRFRRVHEQVVQFYRGSWSQLYHSPVFTADATKRTVRRKGRPAHTGHIGDGEYESQDGGPRLMRSVLYARSCHGTAVHPTQKPIEVCLPLIEYSCPPGGIVVDPFAGSGTTCVAAKMLGRQYIGIEIDEGYCQVARERLRAVDTGVPVAEARAGQQALFGT